MLSQFNLSPCRLKTNQVVEVEGKPAFDCNATVLEMARTYRDVFQTIHLVTWDTNKVTVESQLHALGVVIHVLPAKAVEHLDNGMKQVWAVDKVTQELDVPDDDEVLKIRTDLTIDIRELIAHTERVNREWPGWQDSKQLGYIFSPSSLGPFYIQDMYVSAHARDFKRLWAASAPRSNPIEVNIHAALPVNYFLRHAEQFGFNRWAIWQYFALRSGIATLRSFEVGSVWSYLMRHCFSLFSECAVDKFVLRGQTEHTQTNQNRIKRNQFFWEWVQIQTQPKCLLRTSDIYCFLSSTGQLSSFSGRLWATKTMAGRFLRAITG